MGFTDTALMEHVTAEHADTTLAVSKNGKVLYTTSRTRGYTRVQFAKQTNFMLYRLCYMYLYNSVYTIILKSPLKYGGRE